jgi:hypothetical protein
MNDKLKALIEDLRLNHEFCPKEVILQAADELERMQQGIETLQRTWVGLTDEEIVLIVAECAASHQHTDIHFARAIEAALKERNT